MEQNLLDFEGSEIQLPSAVSNENGSYQGFIYNVDFHTQKDINELSEWLKWGYSTPPTPHLIVY